MFVFFDGSSGVSVMPATLLVSDEEADEVVLYDKICFKNVSNDTNKMTSIVPN